ncbi:chlorophyllide reductase [Xanthobacteraceae bacterium A53D]
MSRAVSQILLPALACVLLLSVPAHAAPSTAQGRISVPQVIQMLDSAPSDRTAHQVLTAYLSGVGEAAGAVVDMGRASCRQPLGLSAADVRAAIGPAAGRPDATQVPATPLIVQAMLERAGCRKG